MVSQLPGHKQFMNSDPHRLIAEPMLLICLFNHSCPCSNWNRKWQPTTVFLPGKLHGQRSLAGYSLWGRKESDTTERLHFLFFLSYNQPAQELTTIWYQTKTFCSCYKLLQHCHYVFSQLSSTNGV